MEFIFEHSTNAILPFLLNTGQYVRSVLPHGDDGEILLHRCKFILTELCTNGIKHSGTHQSVFDIYIDNNHLVIKRTERGQPFHTVGVKRELLTNAHEIQEVTVLTEDGFNRLSSQRVNEHSVRFFVEEASLTYQGGDQPIYEHFGLIIICRSSDSFTYTHLPDGYNTFTASIKLP